MKERWLHNYIAALPRDNAKDAHRICARLLYKTFVGACHSPESFVFCVLHSKRSDFFYWVIMVLISSSPFIIFPSFLSLLTDWLLRLY